MRLALRQRLLFGLLYAAEGAPIGFIWWALPTLLTDAGGSPDSISRLTSLVVLPWTAKVVFAPAVERLAATGWGFRGTILLAQAGMALTLLPLVWMPLVPSAALTGLLLTHGFFAAAQDVGVDAYCIQTVAPEQRGTLNGWMQVGMLGARSVFGGGLLLALGWVGQGVAVGALIGLIGVVALVVARALPVGHAGTPSPLSAAALREAFWRPLMARALAFALLGGAAFEGVAALAGPYLRAGGWTSEMVGGFFAGPAVVLSALGSLGGGWIADRWGRRRVVMACSLWLSSVAVLLSWGGMAGPLYAALYLGVGAFTASTYALFMDVCTERLEGTQFSALMGLTNACEAWAARAVGALHGTTGQFGPGFRLVAAVGALALVMIPAPRRDSVS